MTSTGFTADGYALVLPPGWVRVPVQSGTDRALDEVIERALPRDLPRDQVVPAKVKMKGRLLAATAEAREIGALDLYLPLQGMHGVAIPASFLVTEIPVAPDQDDVAAMRELAGGDSAVKVTVDGTDGVRMDDTVAPDALMTGADVAARRVTYLLPTPGVPRLLGVSFSTVGDGDPDGEFAGVLVGLFDAIMTTFRWRAATEGDQPPP